MKKPYLVQRLQESDMTPENFPVGVGQSGSNDARKLVKTFASHDYMGSSEFEFGTVPEWYTRMAKKADDEVLAHWMTRVKDKKIYVIGEATNKSEINQHVQDLADNKYRLQERSHLPEHLEGDEFYEKTVGWIDLENMYAFFTSKKLFKAYVRYWDVAALPRS